VILLLSPSRGERPGVGVGAEEVRADPKGGVDPSLRALCENTGAFTPIPDPSPLEGEGRLGAISFIPQRKTRIRSPRLPFSM
jgi:hypothetical protein